MQKRIDYIDTAKAVAIISVVYGHVLQFDLYGWALGHSLLGKLVGSYHNYLFMFLSGMVSITIIEKKNILSDIYKRFRRLIVPALAIGIPYTYFTGADVLAFLNNPYKWGYWYLFVLFGLYVISYLFALLQPKTLWWVYILTFPMWYFVNCHTNIIPQAINDFFCFDLIVRYFPFFFIGSIVKRHHLHEKLFSKPLLAVYLVIAVAGFFLRFAGLTIVQDLFRFAEVMSIITICKLGRAFLKQSWLTHIGGNTLYIYVFHYIALQLMVNPNAINWFVENGNLKIDILFATGPVIAAILFSLLVKYLLNKIPYIMKTVFYVG